MTKAEILNLAGLRLGDNSTAFVDTVLSPLFTLVLLDLASAECIELVKRTAEFEVVAGKRGYSLQEITGQTPHPIMRALQLRVYEWSSMQPEFRPDQTFEEIRMSQGEAATGKWRAWRVFPNSRNLEVTPPAGADDAVNATTGLPVMAQLTYIANPRSYGDDVDLTDLHAEDIPCIVAGLLKYGAPFGDQTMETLPSDMVEWETKKREMYGRRWNGRAGQVIADRP